MTRHVDQGEQNDDQVTWKLTADDVSSAKLINGAASIKSCDM